MSDQNEQQPIIDSEDIDNSQIDNQQMDGQMMNDPMLNDQQMDNSQMDLPEDNQMGSQDFNEGFVDSEDNLNSAIDNIERQNASGETSRWSGMLPKIIALLVCLAIAYLLYTRREQIMEIVRRYLPKKQSAN